jgi:uncharacterized protein (DUF305 family)
MEAINYARCRDGVDGHAHATGLPTGMATEAQIAALSKLHGRQLDNFFSALMINHHSGGLHMATYAKAHAKRSARARWRASWSEIKDSRSST